MGSRSGVNCGAISTMDSSTAHRHSCYKLLWAKFISKPFMILLKQECFGALKLRDSWPDMQLKWLSLDPPCLQICNLLRKLLAINLMSRAQSEATDDGINHQVRGISHFSQTKQFAFRQVNGSACWFWLGKSLLCLYASKYSKTVYGCFIAEKSELHIWYCSINVNGTQYKRSDDEFVSRGKKEMSYTALVTCTCNSTLWLIMQKVCCRKLLTFAVFLFWDNWK